MNEQGILKICDIKDMAENGAMPDLRLVPIGNVYYEERTVGYRRLYAAAGADQQIDAVVRAYCMDIPASAKYVIVDGSQYRIDKHQKIIGRDCVDLTLIRLEGNYDVDAG